MQQPALAQWFDQADMKDTSTVGGKGASLGEMFQKLTTIGVKVPNGFTLTTEAFQQFVTADIPAATWKNVGAAEEVDDLRRAAIQTTTLREALEVCLRGADPTDHLNLNSRAALARSLVRETPVPETIKSAIALTSSTLVNFLFQAVRVFFCFSYSASPAGSPSSSLIILISCSRVIFISITYKKADNISASAYK